MKPRFQGLKWASAWMVAATAVVNLSGVAYNRFMSAGLGDQFGSLRSLMGLAGTLGALSIGLGTWLARDFARDAEKRGEAAVLARLRALAWPGFLALLLSSLAVLAAGPLAVRYLKLSSFGDFAWVPLLFAVSVGLSALRAALQGLHCFFNLGLSHMAEGLGRGGLGFAFSGLGIKGGLLALAASQLAAAAAALPGLRHRGAAAPAPKPHLAPPRRALALEILSDTACIGLLTLLFYLDEFTAKHHWSDADASMYSRAALVAKSFLYLASALNLVLLPAAARLRESGGDARRLLLRFLGAALGLNLLGLAFFWWQTPFVISLLTRLDEAQSLALSPLVARFSPVAAAQALLQLTAIFLLAMKSRLTLPLLAGITAAQAAALHAFHADGFMLVNTLGACTVAALLGMLGAALWIPPRKGRENPRRRP